MDRHSQGGKSIVSGDRLWILPERIEVHILRELLYGDNCSQDVR